MAELVNTGIKKSKESENFLFADTDAVGRLKDNSFMEADTDGFLVGGKESDSVFDEKPPFYGKFAEQGTYSTDIVLTSKYKLFVAPREGESLRKIYCAPIGQGTAFVCQRSVIPRAT